MKTAASVVLQCDQMAKTLTGYVLSAALAYIWGVQHPLAIA